MHLASIEAQGTTQPRAGRRPIRFAIQPVRSVFTLALGAIALASVLGCGNNYRPVVSAINPVGPAGQPPKYAIAVSSPSPTSPGLLTIVDFSGDTILINANVGVAPYYLYLNSGGTTGYTLNGDGTVTSFDISTSLQTKDVLQTTLLAGAQPNAILPLTTSTYISEPGRNAIAQLTGSPATLNQELPIAAEYTPVYLAGAAGGARVYAINQSKSGGNGQVVAIDISQQHHPQLSARRQYSRLRRDDRRWQACLRHESGRWHGQRHQRPDEPARRRSFRQHESHHCRDLAALGGLRSHSQ